MPIIFPSNPTINQVYNDPGSSLSWKWTGIFWQALGTIQGVTGIQGNIGFQGIQGLTGPSGGGLTSVTAGTGLTGGTITSTGTIAIDTSVVPQLTTSNTFNSSPFLINQAANSAGLVLKANPVNPQSLIEFRNSSNNLQGYIDINGSFVTNGTIGTTGYLYSVATMAVGTNGLSNSYQLQVINGSSTRIGLFIKAASSQTADLLQFQDSNNSVLAGFNLSGQIFTRRATVGSGVTSVNSAATLYVTSTNTSFPTALIAAGGLSNVDIIQFANSSGTALSKIDSAGNFTKGDGDQIVLASQVF